MDDIEFILSETERFDLILEEYVSRKNIFFLRDWAFEWAYRESMYHHLDLGKTNLLYHIRPYQVLRDAFSLLSESPLVESDAIELKLIPPSHDFSNLIHSNRIANSAIARRLNLK